MALPLRHRAPVWTITLLVAAAVCASSCHPRITDPHDPKFVVAQKDDWTITRAQLDHEINEYLKAHQATVAQVGASNMPALGSGMLRNMVLENLLLARATKLHFKDLDKDDADALGRIKGQFPSDQAFKDKLTASGITEDDLKKRINEQVMIERLFSVEALHDTEPTDKEVNDFYLGHPQLFQVPLKLRASRVLIHVDVDASPAVKAAKKKEIDAARARVVKGEEFSKVATDASEDRNSQPHGGDIGYFQKGENENGFDDVAFNSKLGILSPVFETDLGYQFIKITDIKQPGTLSIDDSRGAIVDNLRRLNIARLEKAYTEKLMKDNGVQYNIPMVEEPPETSVPASGAPAQDAAPGDDQAAPATAPAARTKAPSKP